MISWYAALTRPNSEALALQNLARQGYQVYLPRCRVWISHARRRQAVLRPLFPRYLFVGLDRALMRWRPILSTLGVSDLVRSGEWPLPVPDPVVAALKAGESAGAFDRFDGRQRLRLGERVRITAGAFEDMVGRLVELRDQDRVVVLLDLLGRSVHARLAARALEPA